MTDTRADAVAYLRTIATVAAVAIADDAFDAFDLAKLRSDDGLVVGGVVVWHRVADDVVVARVGNEHDPTRSAVLEVPVPRGTLTDYATGEPLGPATAAQQAASRSAGDAGVILVDADGDVVAAGTWAAQQAGVRRVFVA